MKRIILIAGLAACSGANTMESGPKISGELDCGFAHVRSDETPGAVEECEVDSTKMDYVLQLTVDTRDGDKHNEGMETKAENFPAKQPTVTISADGQAIPAPTFMTRDVFEGKTYESPDFEVPATSKGKTITVHVETTDDRGLKSNVLDLKVLLK